MTTIKVERALLRRCSEWFGSMAEDGQIPSSAVCRAIAEDLEASLPEPKPVRRYRIDAYTVGSGPERRAAVFPAGGASKNGAVGYAIADLYVKLLPLMRAFNKGGPVARECDAVVEFLEEVLTEELQP